MGRFANRIVDSYTFYQWINIEYGIVKRQYKELNDNDKKRLKSEYEEYLSTIEK